MRLDLKPHLFAVACASVLLGSTPSSAAILPTAADLAFSFVQKTTLQAPAGNHMHQMDSDMEYTA